jgi:hypothetical protein
MCVDGETDYMHPQDSLGIGLCVLQGGNCQPMLRNSVPALTGL